MKVHGYVIVQPSVIPGGEYSPHIRTFDEHAGNAWLYFIGPNVKSMDISTRIQAWHDRGYRVKRAVMEIEE